MDLRDTIAREVRHAIRTLRGAPAFTLITVVTLALGIGATTAIFTLLDAVVLRPLPYRDADRLVTLSSPVPLMKGQTEWGVARHEMFYFLAKGHTLDAMGVYQLSEVTVLGSGGGQASERVRWAQTSASLFNVLGFTPARGRLLVADDNHSQLPTVVVLSHRYWTTRFGSDPGVLDRTISVEGFPMRVVGVLPQGAELPDMTVDLWAPAYVDSTTNYNNHTWKAIARLRPGFNAADAQRDLVPLTARMGDDYPQVYRGDFIKKTGFTTRVVSLRDAVVGAMLTRALWTLFAAVGLVLLIATANVANLFLVRLDAKSRETAMRTALGADRGQLAWHYLTESFLLAAVAGVSAIAIAEAMLRILVTVAPSDLPRLAEVHLSWASIVFAVAGALMAGLVFGVVPLMGKPLDLAVLREGGRGMTTSRSRMNARRILVATQMAFAVVLLASAALMVRTFRNLRGVTPGFDPRGVVTMVIALPESRYGGGKDQFASAQMAASVLEQLANGVSRIPGVTRVGFSERLPLLSGDWCTGITLEGPTPDAAKGACPSDALVSPGYFEAMGIRVTGQTLTWSGMDAHDGAMIVSKAFADHYWPNENPIGKGLRFNGTKPPFYRVSGVAEDIRANGVDSPVVEQVYFPMRPIPDALLWGAATDMNLVVKGSTVDATTLARAIGRVLGQLDPQAAVANPVSMSDVLAKSVAKQSFTMALLVIAASLALLLAAVGIYGVISYIVTQRRGEIGVRMALGAQVREVTLMVLRQSMDLAVIGIVVGVLAAIGTTRLLRALLFGVGPTDLATMIMVPVALLGVVVVASYAPARRAARIDPVEALRGD